MSNYQLIQGSAHNIPQIADASVQCIATSPPYFGLRQYAGEQDVDWPAVEYAPMPGLPMLSIPAMRCPLGLESDISAYIGHLILCLREWKRCLRNDGLCWVNLGDSYAGSSIGGGNGAKSSLVGTHHAQRTGTKSIGQRVVSIPAKNLYMIPARFALAAQADGWILRSAIVWAKGVSFLPDYAGSCMPESVTDRPTQSYEMVYMLAKSERYFYDAEAIKEDGKPESAKRYESAFFVGEKHRAGGYSADGAKHTPGIKEYSGRRNLRNTWVINPSPFPGSHFACWPPALVEPMIKASTSEHGCCAVCGAPWVRVVEKEMPPLRAVKTNGPIGGHGLLGSNRFDEPIKTTTTGWQPGCTCAADVVPCTVLDPFAGSGTTCMVAVRLGRHAIGVDLSAQYLTELAPERMDTVSVEPRKLNGHTADYDKLPMFAEVTA